jgi:uncharacterized protein YkvS
MDILTSKNFMPIFENALLSLLERLFLVSVKQVQNLIKFQP